MKYLVDVNIWSELNAPSPNQKVLHWLFQHEPVLAIDSVILAEIQAGILGMPVGRKRSGLEDWFAKFAATVICLPWDQETALCWAKLHVDLKRKGRPMGTLDSFIAASARRHQLVMVTRNVRDFSKANLEILDPFMG